MKTNRSLRRILDNLYGPTGTILVHLLVVIALVRFVHFESREVPPEIQAYIRKNIPVPDLQPVLPPDPDIPDVPTVTEAVTPPPVSTDPTPPQIDTPRASTAQETDFNQVNVFAATSPLSIPNLYKSRSSPGARHDARDRFSHGFGDQTERAVLKALHWLKEHQYEDGSWGPSYRASMTGLALLTFLAHGETTRSDEFGATVRKGLRYLLSTRKNGIFVGGGPVNYRAFPTKYREQVVSYEHAVATYAISEAYGLTRIPYLKKPMEEAVQVMIEGQHEAGSWDYGYVHGPDARIDVSLAGWHIQALKAAHAAGAENRGLRAAIDAGIRGLDLQYRNTKQFQYSTRDPEHAADLNMTSVAVLCKQLTGHVLDDNVKQAMVPIRNSHFIWGSAARADIEKRDTGAWPFYTWYYLTQARFHHGGRTWRTWNDQFAPGLCKMQNDDGSWCPAPQAREAMFGPVYHTALATLQLEVYYRLLPTYQPIKTAEVYDLDALTPDDDITVTFGPEV